MRRWIIWLPLIGALLLGAFLFLRLEQPRDEFVRSAMVGKPLPAFDLPPVAEGMAGLRSSDFADGKPRLINLFGSYCIPCIAEAPQLDALKKAGVEIDAIAISDKAEGVATFLARYGNPFSRIGNDPTGAMQLAFGATGVPETYVIGGDGKIFYQHIGEIRDDDVPMLLKKLEAAR